MLVGCAEELLVLLGDSASLRKATNMMRDRINSTDQIVTASSMLPTSTLPPSGRTEDVMGVSSVTDHGFSQGGNVLPITECAVSTNAFGAVTPELSDLDSDAVWVAMQKQQNQAMVHRASGWALFRPGTTDQQCDEIENANWRVFVDSLGKSYAKRSDTIVWSMIVFILAVIFLIPIREISRGASACRLRVPMLDCGASGKETLNRTVKLQSKCFLDMTNQ